MKRTKLPKVKIRRQSKAPISKIQRQSYNRRYYLKHKERLNEASNRYFQRNKHKLSAENYKRHRQKMATDDQYRLNNLKKSKERYWANREWHLVWHRNHWRKLREDVMQFVSSGEMKCKNCNYADLRALQVDHINGGGCAEIRKFRDNKKYLEHIKKTPERYQLLCANCNWIKRHENKELYEKKSDKKNEQTTNKSYTKETLVAL